MVRAKRDNRSYESSTALRKIRALCALFKGNEASSDRRSCPHRLVERSMIFFHLSLLLLLLLYE